jgi:hypothetical protein
VNRNKMDISTVGKFDCSKIKNTGELTNIWFCVDYLMKSLRVKDGQRNNVSYFGIIGFSGLVILEVPNLNRGITLRWIVIV